MKFLVLSENDDKVGRRIERRHLTELMRAMQNQDHFPATLQHNAFKRAIFIADHSISGNINNLLSVVS